MTKSRFIAHVALPSVVRITNAEFAAHVMRRSTGPRLPVRAVEAADGTAPGRGGLLELGDRHLAVMHVDAPLPPDVFADDAHQRHGPGWQAAARTQRAHIVVVNFEGAENTAAAIKAAASVMEAAAALTELAPEALGVSWAASVLFLAPEPFRDAARRMATRSPPLEYLIKPRCTPARRPPGRPAW
jgi:hypothetical protein